VELANALISLAAAEQQTNQFDAALPLLREAESISARHPSDERLAGYVSSYCQSTYSHRRKCAVCGACSDIAASG
jgi:hypothetical protein